MTVSPGESCRGYCGRMGYYKLSGPFITKVRAVLLGTKSNTHLQDLHEVMVLCQKTVDCSL